MDGTQSDTKQHTRRSVASHRLLVVLGLVGIVLLSGVALGAVNVIEDFEDGSTSGWSDQGNIDAVNDPPEAAVGDWYGNISGSTSLDFSDEQHTNISFWAWQSDSSNVIARIQDGETGDSTSDDLATLDNDNGKLRFTGAGGTTNIDVNYDTWYRFELTNIDYQNDSYDFAMYDINGNEEADLDGRSFRESGVDSMSQIGVAPSVSGNNRIDHIQVGTFVPTNTVSGNVTDPEGVGLNNSTIADGFGNNTTSEANGSYSLSLQNGTYNLTASKDGYISETQEVTVAGSDVTGVNFTLLSVNESLDIDARRFIRHDTTIPYEVTFATDRTASGTLQRRTITDDDTNLTVESNDTDALTVNNGTNRFASTSNRSVNKIVTVTANYSWEGNTYTTDHNVTVANVTIDNFEILPPWARLEATISPGSTGGSGAGDNDHSFMLIMIATFTAVAGTLLMSTFVGLGSFSIVIITGWILGMTGAGLMLVVLTIVGFAGLNLAANIDYAVT